MQRIFVYIFLLLLPIETFARAGGGGSSGGGGGGGGGGSIIGLIFALILYGIVHTSIYLTRRARERTASKQLTSAAEHDAAWETSKLTERASSLFLAYQEAWCKDDSEWIKTICTPDFAARTNLKMDVLRNMGRENLMTNTRILSVVPEEIHDEIDDSKDAFTMRMRAASDDRLIDKDTNSQLFRDDSDFVEYWTFDRAGNDWYIAGIRQETEEKSKTHKTIEEFAQKNELFYEPDFGWLMLPIKGELFRKNKIGTSDINDHVIGKYREKIVEFYTMRSYANGPNWLIAQAILPIGHFDILVRPKKFLQITPFGMKHQSTESNAFDKIFTIDSDPKDNITTFELLTPDFMQYMIDLPFEITIEVVGNTLYIATTEMDKSDPKAMLDLLDKAFDTMKM